MMPVTRARTSTSREPSVWPTYSNDTGIALGATVTAVTSGGGMPPPGPPLCWLAPLEGPQPDSAAASASRKATERELRIGWYFVRRVAAWCYRVVTLMLPIGNSTCQACGYDEAQAFETGAPAAGENPAGGARAFLPRRHQCGERRRGRRRGRHQQDDALPAFRVQGRADRGLSQGPGGRGRRRLGRSARGASRQPS